MLFSWLLIGRKNSNIRTLSAGTPYWEYAWNNNLQQESNRARGFPESWQVFEIY